MDVDLAGLVLAERYRLERRLARGGMADVYRGVDLRLGRQVAVKIPHRHLAEDPAFVERLKREARAVAALTHPNVVAVYDQDEYDGQPFLVMELVEGESVGTLLNRQCPLPIARAVGIVLDVLAALEHAHARGIVHRDVKPQNVLLTPEGRAKLADFGIALTSAATPLTAADKLLGSIHYLAPERLSGQPASPCADIYSVGVLLYQMLVGQLPFEGDSTVDIAAQHQQREADPPSTHRPDLPAWVNGVVLRALAKDPSRRYPSASAMREDLSRRLAAHNAPTETIRTDPLGAPSARPSFKKPAVARKKPRRRIALYAAAFGAVVLLSSLALLLGLALYPSIIPTRAVSGTPTRQADGATTAAVTPAPAAFAKASPTPTEVAATATPTPTPTPTATAAPPTPTATPVPPTATPTPSIRRSLETLMSLVPDRMPRGEAGKQWREIRKDLEDIEEEIEDGDSKDAADKIRDLIKKLRDMGRKGEIERDLSERLIAGLTELEARLR